MGASKQRLARMIAAHPHCIFCGGANPTTSVEHMPSRTLFDNKLRPKGLEFPSCQECQNSTRREELLISMLSRMYPDAATAEARAETRSIIAAALHNFPGLGSETLPDQLPILERLGIKANHLPTWNFLDLGGPTCTEAIEKFAIKLAKALHFELTGEIVPSGAAIFYHRYSNLDAMTGGMPDDLMEALGDEKMLAMGKLNSLGTFSYQSATIPDTKQTAHMAYFRQSFALLLRVYPDVAEVEEHAKPHVKYV